jgi:hypothetical protein
MARLKAEDLRALALALDRLAEAERETGVLLEGHGGNTLTGPDAVTYEFGRETTPDAELIAYWVEI